MSRYWVHQLVQRYRAEGEAAYEPRSRRPHTNPRAVPPEVEDRIVRLRKELTRKGLDAGADTIRTHLARRTPRSAPGHRSPAAPGPPDFAGVPAVATIWRILTRRGFVTPQPQKRPRSSWRSFPAEQPNERWQADTTRPKATATGPYLDPHWRVRHDRIDTGGSVTLRHNSRLHHIGLGTRLAGTPVTLLVDDLHIRVIHRHTGELIRELVLDPTRDYQPRGLPPGPPKKSP